MRTGSLLGRSELLLALITFVIVFDSVSIRTAVGCIPGFGLAATTRKRQRTLPRRRRECSSGYSRPLFPCALLGSAASVNNGHHQPRDPDSNGNDSESGGTTPRHIAFICDGNSRWASSRGLPAAAGHAAGADRLVETLDFLRDAGVSCCTFYAFSTENWNRPASEVRAVLDVVERTARRYYRRLLREGDARLRILGDLDDERIPASLRDVLRDLSDETRRVVDARRSIGDGPDDDDVHQRNNKPVFTLCVAVNYGGRQDIVAACRRIAKLVADGGVDEKNITEDVFAAQLGTSGIPDPDLIVRTSGESRLSNFLLWNSAYSELYFTDVLWPDFDGAALAQALDWYATRRRRFGSRTISATRTRGTRTADTPQHSKANGFQVTKQK